MKTTKEWRRRKGEKRKRTMNKIETKNKRITTLQAINERRIIKRDEDKKQTWSRKKRKGERGRE